MAAIALLGIIAFAFSAGAIVMAFICSGSHQDLIAENDRLREQLAPTYEYPSTTQWHDVSGRTEPPNRIATPPPARHDPTHGQIDFDIQDVVEALKPVSIAQRVAIENTLQERRRREQGMGIV